MAGCWLVLSAWACHPRGVQPSPSTGCDARSVPVGSTPGATLDQMRRARQATFGTDLTISINGPTSAATGERVDVSVTIANRGPGLAQETEVDIELPALLAFRSSSTNCQEYRPPGGIRCTLLPISAGHTFEFNVGAQVKGRPDAGLLAINANVTGGPSGVIDPEPSNNAATLQLVVTPSPVR
jgi:hypothetical protein